MDDEIKLYDFDLLKLKQKCVVDYKLIFNRKEWEIFG